MINMAAIAMRSAGKGGDNGSDGMSKDILALICPDWCDTALVLDAVGGHVAYANWRCLNMLERRRPAWLAEGRLVFESPDFNSRFYLCLEKTVADGAETAALIEHDEWSNSWLSVTIHNGQGLFRDVLERRLGNGRPAPRLVIVEFATNGSTPEPAALAALAQSCSLAPAEFELVNSVARGISLEEIAEARGVALSTVRQRMKIVLAKTKCHRQSELVHLVMSLCPGRPPWSSP